MKSGGLIPSWRPSVLQYSAETPQAYLAPLKLISGVPNPAKGSEPREQDEERVSPDNDFLAQTNQFLRDRINMCSEGTGCLLSLGHMPFMSQEPYLVYRPSSVPKQPIVTTFDVHR